MPLQLGKAKGVADVVFVVDVSGSMSPVIEAVKSHINTFVESIRTNSQSPIDLRLGLVAHETSGGDRRGVTAYPFTNDVPQFQGNLASCDRDSAGDEFGLPALDRALDFDWRPVSRRFVISFTDEPVAGGSDVEFQLSKLQQLTEKFVALRVSGYVIGPDCPHYDNVCAGPRMVRMKVGQAELATYDFGSFLQSLGKTVSSTPNQEAPTDSMTNLYGT